MSKKYERMVLVFEIVFFCFLIFGCTPSPEELIKKYQQVHNRHQVDDAMSYYTDDIEFEMVGTWTKKGKTEIRKLEEWDASVGGYLAFENVRTKGTVVTCTGKETNKWFRLVDIDTIYYEQISFTLRGNKISSIKAQPDSASFQEIQHALTSVMNWASEQNPDLVSTLMPDNEFEYSYENGQVWIQLLKKWRLEKDL